MILRRGRGVQLFVVLFSRRLTLSRRIKCILRHIFYLVFSSNTDFCINVQLTSKNIVGLNFRLRVYRKMTSCKLRVKLRVDF